MKKSVYTYNDGHNRNRIMILYFVHTKPNNYFVSKWSFQLCGWVYSTRFIFEIDQTCQNSNIRVQTEFDRVCVVSWKCKKKNAEISTLDSGNIERITILFLLNRAWRITVKTEPASTNVRTSDSKLSQIGIYIYYDYYCRVINYN